MNDEVSFKEEKENIINYNALFFIHLQIIAPK
jgi:hypothetical protein